MDFSSEAPLERGLDANLLVYSLLEGHPAAAVCEQFILGRTGWFTTSLTLLEAKTVLVKVYGVPPPLATRKLRQMAAGPLPVTPIDRAVVEEAMHSADVQGLDLFDAVLLESCRQLGVRRLASADRKLALACRKAGIQAENPMDRRLRGQMATWEAAHLPSKGLPRLLREVHRWLSLSHPEAAGDFWSHTSMGSRLP
jgi:predicted nucleic acid-binding protein